MVVTIKHPEADLNFMLTYLITHTLQVFLSTYPITGTYLNARLSSCHKIKLISVHVPPSILSISDSPSWLASGYTLLERQLRSEMGSES